MRERGLAEKRDATDVRLSARRGPVRETANLLAGVAPGAVLALAEFAFLLVSSIGLVPIVAARRSRERVVGVVHRCSRQLAVLEQRRLARFHHVQDLGPYSDRNAFRYLARRWPVGGLGGLVLLLLIFAMAEGHTNPSIAEQRFISQSAVEKHSNSIFDKFALNHVTGYSRRVLAILRYLGT